MNLIGVTKVVLMFRVSD